VIYGRALLAMGISLAALSFFAEPARASGTTSAAEGRAAWVKGKQLLAQKKTDLAVAALEDAVNHDPLPQYQLDLARALDTAGSLAEAHIILDALASDPTTSGQLVARAAKQKLADVDKRLPSLTVETAADDVEVTANGRKVEIGEPTRLDPGSYVVELRRDGERVGSRRIRLSEGTRETLRMSDGDEQAQSEPRDGSAKSRRSGGTYLPAALSFAVSGVGLTAGSILGVLAFGATADLQTACGGSTCPPEQAEELERATLLSHLATAGFVTGAVGLGLGLTFTFTLGKGDTEAAREATLRAGPSEVMFSVPF
jgi:hypothetical protein